MLIKGSWVNKRAWFYGEVFLLVKNESLSYLLLSQTENSLISFTGLYIYAAVNKVFASCSKVLTLSGHHSFVSSQPER